MEVNCELLDNIECKIQENSKKIFRCLDGLLVAATEKSRLLEAMRYSALAGGKCLRSFFLIESGKAFGVDEDHLLITACCIEIIHSYSLIHDDLPAMDDDDLRRGMPSCHKAYDEATAILAGDALLTIAFEILSSEQNKLPDHQKIAIINIIAKSIGHLGMAGGQMLDMIFEKQDPTVTNILKMQRMKTAYLFAAAGASSAIIANLPHHKYEAFVSYAFSVGLVFQIVDDLLDATGDEVQLGKKTGKDAGRGKAGLHNIMGSELCWFYAKQIAEWGIEQLKNNEIENDIFLSISSFVLKRDF